MKRYSFFHAPFLSFFSGALYRDVARNWRGMGFLYMFVLLAVLWIPSIIKLQVGVNRFVDVESKKLTDQIPAITISHGKVSTDVPTPYYIKDPDSGTTFAIIDTTGGSESLDSLPGQGLLLTKTKLIMRNERETKSYDLAPVESFYLDRAKVESWLVMMKTWCVPVSYPLALVFSFIIRIIKILIYALIGLLIAYLLHVNLGYQTLMRLAAIAMTPVLILDLILEFSPGHIPLWSILAFLICVGYMFFAVKANSEPEAPPEPMPWARPPDFPT
jgi:hypothetical protein